MKRKLLLVGLVAAGTVFAYFRGFQAKAENAPLTHYCVIITTAPGVSKTTCTGSAQACASASDCN